MRTSCPLFDLFLIAGPDDIDDDLSDADRVIRLQETFPGDTLMVDEGTIGTVEVDDRDLSHRLIHPNFGMMARSSRILHNDVICAGSPNGSLSPL